MTKELIEKYVDEILGVPAGVVIDRADGKDTSEREAIESILTRLLEAYDAQKPVEGWHRECGDTIANFVNDNSRAGKPTYSAEIAALIAQHAPKGVEVELLDAVGDVLEATMSADNEDLTDAVEKLREPYASTLAAQGEK